nr:hypothetical protein [archaeon]
NETGFRTTKEDLIEIPGIRSATIERKNGPRTFSLKVFVAKKFEGELRSGNAEIPEWVKISELDNLKILGNTKEFTLEGLKWITKSI